MLSDQRVLRLDFRESRHLNSSGAAGLKGEKIPRLSNKKLENVSIEKMEL